jgi:hypothetical protein
VIGERVGKKRQGQEERGKDKREEARIRGKRQG